MKSIKVRNLILGEGMPKICVPVTGVTEEEILKQTKEAAKQHPDLLEWRADFYEALFEQEKVEALAGKIREILVDVPLIFTIRTSAEAGNCKITPEDYVDILKKTAKSEAVDLIDVEWFMKDLEREALVKTLHEEKKIIVASNHHFHETPSVADMEEILQVMEDTEADIRKLAVMPSEAEDVLKLLIATVHANKTGEAPVITMSMSGLGAVSRVCGQVFGSVVTFGTVGAASAPGQLEITQLRRMLEQLQP